MFEASAVKFCKSVGEESLLPAPSVYEAERCKTFQVVVKKHRRWWSWQSPSYQPSPFTLSQLIDEEDHIKEEVNVTSRNLLSYNKIHKLSVSGKLGSEIKAVLDVELDGSDSVDVEAKYGEVWKSEADQTQLMAYVRERHLNLDHAFLKQVRASPRRSLSVVVGSCYLKAGGTVTAKKTIKADEKINETASTIATLDEDIDVNNEDDKTLTLPPGTIVAYSVCELLVDADDGKMTLCIDKNIKGGFVGGDTVDGATSGADEAEAEVSVMFQPVLDMQPEEKEKLRHSVLRMCGFPADVDTCLVLLKQCVKLGSSGVDITKTTDVTLLGNKFLCPPEVWTTLLSLVGFRFSEGGAVDYPTESALLSAALYLYEALLEIREEALQALSALTAEYAKPLIYLLTQTISEKALLTSDAELEPLYADSNPGQVFVEALAFGTDASGHVVAPPPSGGERSELHGASRALYGLFWEKEYDSQTSGWGCVVL